MTRNAAPLLLLLAACAGQDSPPPAAATAPPLRLLRTIDLPDVAGRIDHLACSPQDHRLFVAALGNGSVEVVDLARGVRERSLGGLAEPQGIAFATDAQRVVVACGGDGVVIAFDAATLREVARRDVGDDADNVRIAPDGTIVVGHGAGALARLAAADLQPIGAVACGGHPESFQLLPAARALVNVPDAGDDRRGAVVLLDLGSILSGVTPERGAVTASWRVPAAANFPMALEPATGRALIGCRRPARLLQLDPGSGQVVAETPCIGDLDDVFVDEKTARVFAIGGEGAIDVFALDRAPGLRPVARVPTRAGARTGLFVPELRRLFVALPARDGAPAAIQEFAVDG